MLSLRLEKSNPSPPHRMKVIVTGASGLAGHAIARHLLSRKHEVIALYHKRDPLLDPPVRTVAIDLTEENAVIPFLLHEFPDVIIHAAAVSEPAACDSNPEAAEKANVAAPARLAQIANHLNARFYHLSTDMVFDGSEGPWRSTSVPAPTSLYGQMKLLAEREVLKAGGDFATVLRIPILNGNSPHGQRSVHEKLLMQLAAGNRPVLFTNELRQPLGVSNLAELVTELVERPNLHGIFHWAGQDVLSRAEMGLAILRHFGLPETLVETQECTDPTRPLDLRFELAPLVSKVRTTPMPFAEQLTELSLPPALSKWYAEVTGKAPTIQLPRLIKGKDF